MSQRSNVALTTLGAVLIAIPAIVALTTTNTDLIIATKPATLGVILCYAAGLPLLLCDKQRKNPRQNLTKTTTGV